MAVYFKVVSKEGLTTAEVDNLIARELYNIEPDPKHWTTDPETAYFDWFNFIGQDIANLPVVDHKRSWFETLLAIVRKHFEINKKYFDNPEDENKRDLEIIRKYYIKVIRFLSAKGIMLVTGR